MTEREWLCQFCGKDAGYASNWCSWECGVALAKANGAIEHLPNGLPIGCINANGLLTECEHGDHDDYIFPVEVDGDDHPEDLAALGVSQYPQRHALIYTDGTVALTLYECCYTMWLVHNGEGIGGRYQPKHERLSEQSRAKIVAHVAERQAKR